VGDESLSDQLDVKETKLEDDGAGEVVIIEETKKE